jgi:predicted cupin superfamily sugar epimerase
MDDAKKIIDLLGLKPHREGGYYKQVYKSPLTISIDHSLRSLSTSIYYLLESHDFSCWHRLKADEIWHFYCGGKAVIYQINPQGELSSIFLGNLLEHPNTYPQCLIPANTWFAAKVLTPDSFIFVGCSVSPGFEYDDFEVGDETLLKQYPQHQELILPFLKN